MRRGGGRGGHRGGGRGWNRGRGRHHSFHNHHRGGRNVSHRRPGPPEDYSVLHQIGTPSNSSVSIAVEGCCHGALDAIYDRLQQHEKQSGQSIDLFVCCGDFQSLRTMADYHSFAVPRKYQALGDFQQYYTGKKVAPILTLFIGGNHEASQSLSELYHGGWVAPNIYYLGSAGVVNFRGIRIGGLSGIYKSHDYQQSRHELPPYDRGTMRSIYHYRNLEVYRLKCLSQQQQKLDIMLSHDWPQGIEQYGDTQTLIRRKPFFEREIATNTLGSPPLMELLQEIQPKHWFSAHLHVKFTATVHHAQQQNSTPSPTATVSPIPSQVIKAKPDSSTKEEEEEEAIQKSTTQFVAPETSTTCSESPPDLTDMMTQFLSLDKCLPRRHYLSIVHLPSKSDRTKLEYDAEWLAILKKTHALSASLRKQYVRPPSDIQHTTQEDMEWIRERFNNDLTIPEEFECTVLPEPAGTRRQPPPLPRMGNPQTDTLLERLGLDHLPNLSIPYTGPYRVESQSVQPTVAVEDENEIDLDDEMPEATDEATAPDNNVIQLGDQEDENEIDLADENEIEIGDDEAPVESTETKKPRLGD